jgi:hypothetical protein
MAGEREIIGVMAGDELDELYRAKPEGFTELRTRLAEAARTRGDAAAVKRISAARKPTTAAWIVNNLVHQNNTAKNRLADLGERLRSAHASMDGDLIRELSGEQRRLLDELRQAAFDAAETSGPSAAVRNDVAATLQAAIADPDVAQRLGRLTKAERWSGFGEFGEAAPVSAATRGATARRASTQAPQPAVDDSGDDARVAAREQREAKAALAEAERARADADDELAERQADLAAARLRRNDARKRLEDAGRRLAAAEVAFDAAKQAGRDAAELVKQAKARLNR